ncbi:MAG: siderophore biosynthesis protein SbnG [Burkholderiales bacterium]|jgi:4-hydroxy-2-oxoheptanedioate aldolase|nr:siderophore biosynthesis protein SbnG [Burkholderiales bacterium]
MVNRIREALARGDTVTGMLLFTGSPMIVEMMAAAGVDFVIIDMEHSALDLDRCAHLIRAADASGITPFVRVPDVAPALIKKLLNLGAMGIAVPHANRANCLAALQAVKYAPEGERGACPIVRAARYSPREWNEYAIAANRAVMVIPLLEDKAAIERFDELASMPGLEVFFVGPTDLGISLGVPNATFDDPKLGGALDQVIAAARRNGKFVMTTIGNRLDPEYGRAVAKRGVQLIVLGTDGHLFLDAVRRMNAVKTATKH